MRKIVVTVEQGDFTDDGSLGGEKVIRVFLAGDEEKVVLVYPKNKPVEIERAA